MCLLKETPSQPKVEQPKAQQPKVEQPKVEQPKKEQPKVEHPKPQPKPQPQSTPKATSSVRYAIQIMASQKAVSLSDARFNSCKGKVRQVRADGPYS